MFRKYCSFSKGQSFVFTSASKWTQSVSKDGVKFRQVWCYLAVTTLCYYIHPPVFPNTVKPTCTVFLLVLYLTQAGILEKRGTRGVMWDVFCFVLFFSVWQQALNDPTYCINQRHIFTIRNNELLLLLLVCQFPFLVFKVLWKKKNCIYLYLNILCGWPFISLSLFHSFFSLFFLFSLSILFHDWQRAFLVNQTIFHLISTSFSPLLLQSTPRLSLAPSLHFSVAVLSHH